MNSPGGEMIWANAMVADHILVQVEDGIGEDRLANTLPARMRLRSHLIQSGLYLVEVPMEGERAIERALLAVNQLKGVVKLAEPDFCLTSSDVTPNDPLFSASDGTVFQQWHLPKIMAPRAWQVLSGPPFDPIAQQVEYEQKLEQTIVAIVDTGIDYRHPDLEKAIWLNSGETGMDAQNRDKATNGVDDDNNGFIDDWHGWDFVDEHSVKNYQDPMDDVGHGTHVAGIIGAVGNNAIGGSGVCWNIKLLNLRIIKSAGEHGTLGYYSGAVEAMGYIRKLNASGHRVAVANHSWGGSAFSTTLLNALAPPAAVDGVQRPIPYGCLHVAAAGNRGLSLDRLPVFPASLPSGYVISVGASDESDQIAQWKNKAGKISSGSNYGLRNVDLFAPGSNISSTKLKPADETRFGYVSLNGTSMAAPQVSAAVALLRMWMPEDEARNRDIRMFKQIVIDNVDRAPAFQDRCVSGGRLNLARLLDRVYQPILLPEDGKVRPGLGGRISALDIGMGLTGQVAKGGSVTLAVRNGKVWAWGNNNFGQLGPNGPAKDFDSWFVEASSVPVEVPGLDNTVMVAATNFSSFALLSDGSVWSWGANFFGALGTGTEETIDPVPHSVNGLRDVADSRPQAIWISGTDTHVLVVNEDGALWAWGRNDYGQLGNGTTTDSDHPIKVSGLTDVIMASTGAAQSLALKADGTVWRWGATRTGSDLQPVQVPGLTGVVYIASSPGNFTTSYAIKSDGTVWWWGSSDPFSVGIGGIFYTTIPLQYPGLEDMILIAPGERFCLGLNGSGQLWAWGDNDYGRLGIGGNLHFSAPKIVPFDTTEGIAAIAAGPGSAVVILGSGELLGWGENSNGDLGTGVIANRNLPARIAGLSEVTQLSSGRFCAAQKADGSWITWGGNSDGTLQNLTLPHLYTGFSPMINVKSTPIGHSNSFAQASDGTLWRLAGLGDASGGTPIPNLGPVVDYSVGVDRDAGDFHVLAVLPGGQVKASGYNSHGQLGNDSTSRRDSFAEVAGLTNVLQVAAGQTHSLALKKDGTVWSWGSNEGGELGDGTALDRHTPVAVKHLNNIVMIAADSSTSLALDADGTVWAWGNGGALFALPNLHENGQHIPARIPGLPRIKALHAADNAVLCVTAVGEVWAWSSFPQYTGRLKHSLKPSDKPAPVVGLSGIVAVSIGNDCAFALRDDGTVYSWGSNWNGGLGDNSNFSAVPVSVLGFAGSSETLSTLGTGDEKDSWQLQNFSVGELLNDAKVGDDADPDHDGVANLIEYALGVDPRRRVTAAQLPQHTELLSADLELYGTENGSTPGLLSSKHYLKYSVPRHGIRKDIEYVVEVSTDLVHWKSGPPATITVLDTADRLEVFSTTPLEVEPHQYMRLKIQRSGDSQSALVTPFITSESDDGDIPETIAGSFTGWIARHLKLNEGLGGRLDFTVSTSGRMTGFLSDSGGKHPFIGELYSRKESTLFIGTAAIPRRGKSQMAFNFSVDAATGKFVLTSLGDGHQETTVTGWRKVWSAKHLAAAYKGRYTLELTADAGSGAPQQASFVNCIVHTSGTASITGLLADGTRLTSSGLLGPEGELVIYQSSPKADTLLGNLKIAPETGMVSGTLTWSRPLQKTGRFPGFSSTPATVSGSRSR